MAKSEPKIKVTGKTDVGLVRAANEDYLHIDEKNHVYVVCDGMGGHQAGDVASMLAAATIDRAFNQFPDELAKDEALTIDKPLPDSGKLLIKAIRLANRAVYNKAMTDTKLSGMGTTVVSIVLEKDLLTVAHVGDSRAYRLDEDALFPLTKDHSWIVEMQESQQMSYEEANNLVAKNVITRALGVKDTVEVDYRLTKAQKGDIYILCSDGLCGFAEDDEIFDVATKHRDDIDKMADSLVQMANDRGGSDNVTVIVAQVDSLPKTDVPEVDPRTLGPENPTTLEAEDRWLAEFEEVEDDLTEEKDERGSRRSRAGNAFFLIGIFVAFAVVAALMIWFSLN